MSLNCALLRTKTLPRGYVKVMRLALKFNGRCSEKLRPKRRLKRMSGRAAFNEIYYLLRIVVRDNGRRAGHGREAFL